MICFLVLLLIIFRSIFCYLCFVSNVICCRSNSFFVPIVHLHPTPTVITFPAQRYLYFGDDHPDPNSLFNLIATPHRTSKGHASTVMSTVWNACSPPLLFSITVYSPMVIVHSSETASHALYVTKNAYLTTIIRHDANDA